MSDKDSHYRTVRVEIENEMPDGRRVIRRLTGEDAARWDEFCRAVSGMAYVHGANPSWEELSWEVVGQSEAGP